MKGAVKPTLDSVYRVLCVEDHAVLQRILKIGLKRYGFEVVMASHGADALAQFGEHLGRFGSIVTDHDLPQMSGLELVSKVREIGFQGRIVVMSGSSQAETLGEYEPYRIKGFFRSPFDIRQLAAMLLRPDQLATNSRYKTPDSGRRPSLKTARGRQSELRIAPLRKTLLGRSH